MKHFYTTICFIVEQKLENSTWFVYKEECCLILKEFKFGWNLNMKNGKRRWKTRKTCRRERETEPAGKQHKKGNFNESKYV